jgi:prepilin-type N-terminal cleavage/methylation domain-containing protein
MRISYGTRSVPATESSYGTRRVPGTFRRGITLTEILIAIMILGVGMVSLATLFPIGLSRMRDAARYSRTKVLVDSVAADGTARSLLSPNSFALVDAINFQYNLTPWYVTNNGQSYALNPPTNPPALVGDLRFLNTSPLTQDTPGYGQDYFIVTDAGPPVQITFLGANASNSSGYGLPFAYDPLWRYQTPPGPNRVPNDQSQTGYYLGDQFEARFGSGIGFIRADPSDGGLPSAHGLQRITNFNRPYLIFNGVVNPVMPISSVVPNIFVSQEDVVWVEALAQNAFSPVLPDLSLPSSPNAPALDWHYSWMFTGYQVSSSGGATFRDLPCPRGGRTRSRARRSSRPSGGTAPTCKEATAPARIARFSCDGFRRSLTPW